MHWNHQSASKVNGECGKVELKQSEGNPSYIRWRTNSVSKRYSRFSFSASSWVHRFKKYCNFCLCIYRWLIPFPYILFKICVYCLSQLNIHTSTYRYILDYQVFNPIGPIYWWFQELFTATTPAGALEQLSGPEDWGRWGRDWGAERRTSARSILQWSGWQQIPSGYLT